MDAALVRHGPDASGTWSDGAVGLGHRLMRFTPQDRFEQQPVVSADGQFVLVCDGRVDNRVELADELGIAGRIDELADSALVLRAYAQWGQDCLRHLVGAYTLAVWDAREHCLMVARSAVDGPCLWFHTTPDAVTFATMPKGLFAVPGIVRACDEQFLADYLARAGVDPSASFYRGISRLLPGQVLIVGRAGWSLRHHWQPDLTREIRFPRDEQYVEALVELLDRVVKDHLRSLSPAGVMLSGGLDSTAVAALASEILGRDGQRLAAFTEVPRAGFDGTLISGRYADETPYVEAMARRYSNLDINLIHTDRQFYLDGLESFFQSTEVPFPNASNRVWYEAILRAAERSGTCVLLHGGMGNLTMSWGGGGLLAHVLAFVPNAVYLAVDRLRGGVATSLRDQSPIHADFALANRVEERSRETGRHLRFRSRADRRPGRARSILAGISRADGLGAGYEALFGVTGRDPTADVRVVEFCLAVPEEQYRRDGDTRWLIRRSMASRVPPQVLANRKRGLQAADWFERMTGARAQILDALTRIEESDVARRAIDLPRLRQLADLMPHATGSANRLLADYRFTLSNGLMTGCFLRWMEGDRS
jgi:asparagine synthase (glutamine-hydrolysing)